MLPTCLIASALISALLPLLGALEITYPAKQVRCVDINKPLRLIWTFEPLDPPFVDIAVGHIRYLNQSIDTQIMFEKKEVGIQEKVLEIDWERAPRVWQVGMICWIGITSTNSPKSGSDVDAYTPPFQLIDSNHNDTVPSRTTNHKVTVPYGTIRTDGGRFQISSASMRILTFAEATTPSTSIIPFETSCPAGGTCVRNVVTSVFTSVITQFYETGTSECFISQTCPPRFMTYSATSLATSEIESIQSEWLRTQTAWDLSGSTPGPSFFATASQRTPSVGSWSSTTRGTWDATSKPSSTTSQGATEMIPVTLSVSSTAAGSSNNTNAAAKTNISALTSSTSTHSVEDSSTSSPLTRSTSVIAQPTSTSTAIRGKNIPVLLWLYGMACALLAIMMFLQLLPQRMSTKQWN